MKRFVTLENKVVSEDINMFFEDWRGKDETVCVFSPHDDDGIIGAGYAIMAALENNANVHIFIFCSGNAGYSIEDQKDTIESIRKKETINSYEKIGVKKENIFWFDYSDFSVINYLAWKNNGEETGSVRPLISKLRELKATRVLVPNGYKEHMDHLAVNMIGTYGSPQAGDPILVDWGQPTIIKSVMQYSVWGDLTPMDAIINNRNINIRANKIILVNQDDENSIRRGIVDYKSQGEIIKHLVESREERKTSNNDYIELYLDTDPRPKMNYLPYVELIDNLKI